MANKEHETPRILYYQIKGRFVYWIYELKGIHYLAEVTQHLYEEGLIIFLKNSEGKALSSVIDVHEYVNHLNLTYKIYG